MLSTKTVKGIKLGDRGNTALSLDVVKLLKTQDVGYLRTILQQTRKERERLEASLKLDGVSERGGVKILGQDGKAGRHTVFVDSVMEQKAIARENIRGNKKNQTDSDDEDEEMDAEVDSTGIEEAPKDKTNMEDAHNARSAALARLRLLEAVKKRERELVTAEQELELQRAKMSNSIGGFNKKGVKFKIRERKR
jgi:U3 small nucleolar RNA-associated protein 11